MAGQLGERGSEFALCLSRISTRDGDFSQQLVRDGDVLARLIVSRDVEEPPGILLGLGWISLREPVLCRTGLETNVVAPATKRIALEDGFDLAESRQRLVALAHLQVVVAEINEGVGF